MNNLAGMIILCFFFSMVMSDSSKVVDKFTP